MIEKQKQPILAAAYARVSGDKQKKDETIESQVDAIKEYAKANNYTLVNEWTFQDEAEKGFHLERPGLDALRDLVMEGGPDVIIIYKPDRLARKYIYQGLLIEEFQKHGVEVKFLNFETPKTPEEQFMQNMMGAVAEYERTIILDRFRRGRLYKAKKGKLSILPNAPYGFDYIKEGNEASYIINHEASEVVKTMFYLYTRENYSLMSLANYLNNKGIPTPKLGKRWDRTTIRDILKNEAYTGTTYFGKTEAYDGIPGRILRWNGKKITKPRNARRERKKEDWIPIAVPGFISESDFQLAQEQLDANKKFAARNTKEVSLLQGLVVCQECGCSFYKKKRTNQKTTYTCHSMLVKHMPKCKNRSIDQQELDLIVWNEVVRLLKNPNLIEKEIVRRTSEVKNKGENNIRLAKIEKEIKQLEKAKDKLLDAYEKGDCLTLEELRPRMDNLKKKLKELEAEAKNIIASKNACEKQINFKATLELLEKRLSESSEGLSVDEKQKVIRLLVTEIIVGKDFLKVRHCIPSDLKNQNSPLSSVSQQVAPRVSVGYAHLESRAAKRRHKPLRCHKMLECVFEMR
jgi:site-specific DNA recombinase